MFRKTRQGARRPCAGALGLAVLLLLSACQQSQEALYDEAQALIAEGKPEDGLTVLREAAALDPDDGEIQFAIGMTLLRLGRTSEALFPLSKAVETEEYGVQAGVVMASTLAEGRNFEESIAAADRVLERSPEDVAALAIRANAAIGLHQGELALDSVDRLLAIEPGSVPYRHLKASALGEAQRLDDAEALFLELMEIETEEDPGGPARACGSLAKMLIDHKETDRAVERLKLCEEKYVTQPNVALALVSLYDEMGQKDEAIELLQRTSEKKPDDPNVVNALGHRLLAADRFDEAEALASEGLEKGTNPARWAALSSVRKAAGNADGALEAIEEAITLSDPPDQEYLFSRADLLISLGRVDEAQGVREQLTETLYRDTIDGRLAQEAGDNARALEIYSDVLAHWPQNVGVRVLAALAALEEGDREQAKSQLLEATRQAPTESDAAIWLARLHFAEGDYAQAAYFATRQIAERGPTHPDAYLLAARAFRRLGKPERVKGSLGAMALARDGLFAAESIAEVIRFTSATEGPDGALGRLDEMVEKAGLDYASPETEPALIQRFQLLADAGQLDEATRRGEALIAAHPERPTLHMLLGRIGLLKGDAETAGQAFERALELDPEHAGSLAGKALLQRAAGDPAAADTMDRAWQLSQHQDYGYMAARMRLDLGQREEARERFLDLLILHPDQAAGANDLAFLLAEDGTELDRALELARLALRLAPSPEALDTLGFVQLKRDELDAAIGSFRRAIDRGPEYATARYHLALALHEAGRSEEAREALETALETAFPEAEQARALLARLEGGGGTVQ